LNEEQLKKSDLNITPDIGKRKSTEFGEIPKIIRAGEIATEIIIDRILAKVDSAEASVSKNSGNFIIQPLVAFQCLNLPDSIQNTIYEEQSGKFVNYTLIEKALRKIYRTGFYKDVSAVVVREKDVPHLTYYGTEFQTIKEIRLGFSNERDIRQVMFEDSEKDSIHLRKITALAEKTYKNGEMRADFENVHESGVITEPVLDVVLNFAEFRLGKRLNSREMKLLYENILGALRSNNLSVVDIYKFRFESETGVLEICFSDGGFREISIRGNKKTKNELITREIELGSQSYVLKSDLEKSLQNIYGTGLFRQVSIFKDFGNRLPQISTDSFEGKSEEQKTRINTNFAKGKSEEQETQINTNFAKGKSEEILPQITQIRTDSFENKSEVQETQIKQIYSPSLRVNVVEKSERNLRFSFRVDNERKLQLYIDFRNENFFGTGNEVGISAQGGLRDREYRFDLKSYRFFTTYFTYGLAGYYKFRDIYQYTQTIDYQTEEYTRDQTGEYRDFVWGGSFLLGSQVGKSATVFAQMLYENLSRGQMQGNTTPEPNLKLLKLKLGGKVDSENYFPFPTSGTVANYYYETAAEQISGGFSYTKIWFDLAHNFRLGNLSNLKPKVQFGFADKTTPAMEMFSLGGENSFYGMEEDELRGRQVLLASLEYRLMLPIQFFFDTYISARYDLGQMWENTEDIRFKDLRHGLGMAMRFDTPVGEASLSMGRSFIVSKGFSKGSFIWGPYTFYFSIGFNM
ncbi:MAG: BamA/TamA family outer membrane protein, partial [Ignavibacteriae bacterium]|nr:BamA/TamA family outer membrane protein [Ignavibacteriota bacterium]